VRILHTADWHLGRTLEGRSRQAEQEAFLEELAGIVRSEEIDLVLVAGDIYDSVNPPSLAERLFYDSLSRLAEGGRRHVAVIAGNHDSPERLAAAAPLAARHNIHLWGLPASEAVEIGIPRTGETAVLFPFSYPSESRLGDLLTEVADEGVLRSAYSDRVRNVVERAARRFRPDAVNLIMSHLYVLGGAETESERPIQVGGAYTVDPSALCAGAHYTALGHLHRPQYVKADQPIRYSGSPLAYSFSEAGQAKSVTVIDAAPGFGIPASISEIPLCSGRPLVEWKALEGIGQVHAWLDEGRDSRAWIDLTVRLTEALSMDQLQQLRKRHDGIIHIRPVYPEMESAGLEPVRSLPLDELFRRFYSRQTGGAAPEPELVQLFMSLLHPDDHNAAEGKEKLS
jgi:DNA repair protein SbcD/Mre11